MAGFKNECFWRYVTKNQYVLSPVCDAESCFVSKSLSFTMKLEELPAELPSIENVSL